MFIPLLTTRAKRKPDSRINQVGNHLIAGLLFLTLCITPSGCSLTPTDYVTQSNERPSKAIIDDVPFFAQDELQCGPASLAMALNWSGVAVEPSVLTPEVFTPGLKGSLQKSLIGSARRHGRVAYPIAGIDALLTEISAGHPVIVLVNLGFSWYPKWHYALVIGYDQTKGEIILHSGLTAGEILSFWRFNNIWKRSEYWGLLILPPDRLPRVVVEDKWLTAVAGLENAGQWQAATTGYASALKRWDSSFIAWMGLGNSNYNLGYLDSSADAFRQATLIQPDNGLAYNNWAHVLAEQGKLDEALLAAQYAVDLGGPFQDTFHQTLKEIKEMELYKENQGKAY